MRTSAIFATIVAGLHTLTCSAEADAMLRSPQPRSIKANAQQMLILAEQMIRDGRAAQAESILQLLARDPKADVRNEARYRQAMLLEARGENRGAAVLLRRILDDRPGAAPVRLKLATMLHKMGDESSALRDLRALRTSELPPNVARFVDRMSA